MGMAWGGLIITALFIIFIALLGGVGLFALLPSGKEKGSGYKIGIGMGILAFGMFFLLCGGGAFLYLSLARTESPATPAKLHTRIKRPATSTPIPVKVTPPIKQPAPPSLPEKAKPKTTTNTTVVEPPAKTTPVKTATVKKNIKITSPPAWIKQDVTDHLNYLVLHSNEFATTAEAEADLLREIEKQIKAQIHIENYAGFSSYEGMNAPFRMEVTDRRCDIYGEQNPDSGRHSSVLNGYIVYSHGNLYGNGFSTQNDEVILTVPQSALPTHFNKTAWRIPESILRQTLKRQYDETIVRTTGKHSFNMHRLHAQVHITGKDLAFTWRTVQNYVDKEQDKIATVNIWRAGTLLGVLTLWLGTIAAYLRIDTLTNGIYRNRLRVAGVTLLALGTSVLGFIS